MAQKKANEVEGWLARPDPACRVVLIYGPDRGLVSERARAFITKSGFAPDDPFAVVQLEAAELDRDPGRLIDEAGTMPMFADRRLIWVRNAAGQKGLADGVKILAADPPPTSTLLIEAGDLKKGTGIRAIVESAKGAIALPCYADEGRALETLIDDELEKAGMSISLDARQLLRLSLGGDRLASRSELEKLTLYAEGQREITAEDVTSAIGDVSAMSLDKVIDAVLAGDLETFERSLARAIAVGGQLQTILNSALRQFHSLHLARSNMAADGKTAQAAVASMRPPVFFSRQKPMEAALQRWNVDDFARILSRLQAAVLESRKRPDLADSIVRHVLLGIAAERSARRQRQNS
jgi:DNA polymerase III subunit delta